MSWCWEMNDHGKWITNGLRFATKAEAESYGSDLACRWLGMPEPARAGERDDPVTHAWKDGTLTDLASGYSHQPPARVSL
jgi:hypothetical protein